MEEAAKNRKEEARNTLESYMYRLRDLLDEENRDTPFRQCSQVPERSAITEKLEETFEWLHEKGDYAETSQFLSKRNALEYVLHSSLDSSGILTACYLVGASKGPSSTDIKRLRLSQSR